MKFPELFRDVSASSVYPPSPVPALSPSSIATLIVCSSNSPDNGMTVEEMSPHAHDLFVSMEVSPFYNVFRPFVCAAAEFQT